MFRELNKVVIITPIPQMNKARLREVTIHKSPSNDSNSHLSAPKDSARKVQVE